MNEQSREPSWKLDYAGPPTVQGPTRIISRGYVGTVVLAWLWPFAAIGAGISSDRIWIPPAKKTAIVITAIIVLGLLLIYRINPGIIAFWFAFAALLIGVMLFWN